MATTLSDFSTAVQLTAAEAVIISTSSSEKKFIGKVTLTNTSTSNVQVTLWRLLTATTGTTGSGGNWIYRKGIAAGDTVTVDKLNGHVLGNSMKISALSETTLVVNINASGTTET